MSAFFPISRPLYGLPPNRRRISHRPSCSPTIYLNGAKPLNDEIYAAKSKRSSSRPTPTRWPVFLLRHKPRSPKPKLQRLARVLKDRPSHRQCLMLASGTNYQTSVRSPKRPTRAARTNKAIWPAQGEQVFEACVFGQKTRFKFLLVEQIIFVCHSRQHYR